MFLFVFLDCQFSFFSCQSSTKIGFSSIQNVPSTQQNEIGNVFVTPITPAGVVTSNWGTC